MPKSFVVGMDVGSTTVKAVVVDPQSVARITRMFSGLIFGMWFSGLQACAFRHDLVGDDPFLDAALGL